MRYLLLAVVLVIGCGEVEPAGGMPTGGTAGTAADATGAAGTTGQAGTTGAGGAGGAAPTCDVTCQAMICMRLTPDAISGTYQVQKTFRTNSTSCIPETTFATIDHGSVAGWDNNGFSSSVSTSPPGMCSVGIYFTRPGGATCGTEYLNIFLTVPPPTQ